MLLKREPWISTSTLSDWILIHRKDGLQEHFKAINFTWVFFALE